jgi:class 3 adenylate cyclase/tetratricopeptide (TPR) repeat protein
MRCPSCGFENPAGVRFCGGCGTRLSHTCPQCSAENPAGFHFCGNCGTPLSAPVAPRHALPTVTPQSYTPRHLAEKILTSRPALEGERKQVTVLFADLKGSLELLADRGPEEARQLLDPVLECMIEAVHRYEGTVNQVLGDGIMALFGAPIALEDHAVRVCYAALSMQAAVQQYAEEVRRAHGLAVQIRVGLNSGEVVVRAIGNDLHMDYSAIGQTTPLAARMEQLATPGSTLMTSETLQLAEGLVQVTSLGPVSVRGLRAPVEVFELVGAESTRRRLQAVAARGLTRFVGRQTEVEALQHALARAEAGHGQVAAIVGEAGVGKSRLVYECIHSHSLKGWLVLESASVSYGKATPYFPVIDLLRRYVHVEEGDDLRTIRARVTGQVLTLDEVLQEAIPALLALLDALLEDSPFLKLEPPQRRQRTLDALKRVLLRESQVQPLLLVFEDLHWIDAETQALLDTLVESLPTARLPLLVNYRPEYQHGWGSKTYYTQLRLDPLPPASAEDLGTEVPFALLQAIANMPEEVVHRGLEYLQAAEFLYETRLFPEHVYTFKHALTHEVAYGGLLQERRHALHARIVTALEALAPERLAHHAVRGEVWDKALLYCRQAGARAFARAAFREAAAAFEQALVALGHLPKSRDRHEQDIDLRLTLRIMLSSLGEHEQLFVHLQHPKASPRRWRTNGGWDRSLPIWAGISGCGETMTAVLHPASVLLPSPRPSEMVSSGSCRSMSWVPPTMPWATIVEPWTSRGGTWSSSKGSYSMRTSASGPLPLLPPVAASSLASLSWANLPRGLPAATKGLRIAETVAHPGSFIFAYQGIGQLYLRKGDFHKAIPALERCLALCQGPDFLYLFCTAASLLGAAYTLAERVAEALPLLEQAVQQATSISIQSGQSRRVASLGEATLPAGRPEAALSLAQQALGLARTHKERGHEAWILRLLGEIAAQREPLEVEPAAAHYRQALALAAELGMRPLQAHCHRGLGTLYAKSGRPEQARSELSTAMALYRAMEMTFWLPQAEAALAQVEGGP